MKMVVDLMLSEAKIRQADAQARFNTISLELSNLRKNSKNRSSLKRTLSCAKESLERSEKYLEEVIAFTRIADDYAYLNTQIAEMCETRRKLCPNPLIQAIFNQLLTQQMKKTTD